MKSSGRRKNIIAVDVYREFRKKRKYVGRLMKNKDKFIFKYDEGYRYEKNAISLGPDIPLTSMQKSSSKLFASFEDRIPSRENPAYKEYCHDMGISPREKDPLVLLSTIGRKGPSCFVFTPVYDDDLGIKDLIQFRKDLRFSIREFADSFDFSFATIHRIERGKTTGKDALKRIRLYYEFPEVALCEIGRYGGRINDDAREHVEEFFKSKIKDQLLENNNEK
ncbi:MAG: HipA N-terminal domain-containing protein [Halobacteriovoraceae bacterium]|nr:HipA N-terminal domain-containing protein [Halobacteriovoraceae bacterium]